MFRIVPFSSAALLAVLALPTLAPAQRTIPPEDERRAEANVFMNAKVIAIHRDRDRIEVRDNDGVRRTFVLDDDATLPAGRIRAGTDVILAVREHRGVRRVVSVQASEPAPAARIPESSAQPMFYPAPDNRLRSAADQVAFQSGGVAAGSYATAPAPPGPPYVAGSSGGFIDPVTDAFLPGGVASGVTPGTVGVVPGASVLTDANGNRVLATDSNGNAVLAPNATTGVVATGLDANGFVTTTGTGTNATAVTTAPTNVPGSTVGSGGVQSQVGAITGTTIQTGVDFGSPNVVGLDSTQRTLTAPVQGTTTRTQVAPNSGRIVNEPVPTNTTAVFGAPAPVTVQQDPRTGNVIVSDPTLTTTSTPSGTTVVASPSGTQTIVNGTLRTTTPPSGGRINVPAGSTSTGKTRATTATTSGTDTSTRGVDTSGTTSTAASGTADTTKVVPAQTVGTTSSTRFSPASGGVSAPVASRVPGTTATTNATTLTPTTTTGVGTVNNTATTVARTPTVTSGVTAVPGGAVANTQPVRTFTNANLAAISRPTSTSANTVSTSGPGVPAAQGGASVNPATGFITVPGSFAPTGAATAQMGEASLSPTADTTQPAPDLGGLGVDAAPLPTARAVQAFEGSMARLAQRVEEVDSAFARYRETCLGMSSVFGLQTRSWMGIWDGQTLPTETYDQCEPMLSYAVRLGEQVQRGVRTAEDMARRSGVLPGVRRQIRAQYGMDWDGWDH